MRSLWGTGLEARYYFGGRISLRRNSLVYEVCIVLKRFRMTLVHRRKPLPTLTK